MSETVNESLNFYSALGSAITQWEFVEAELCNTFISLIGAQYVMAANTAFYSVVSVEGRLNMVNSAASSTLSMLPDLLKEWDEIHKKIKVAKKKRNALAHFSVMQGHFDKGRHFRLQPSVHNFQSIGATVTTLYYEDLLAAAVLFAEVAERLFQYNSKLPRVESPTSA
jgi:hypothetical protein